MQKKLTLKQQNNKNNKENLLSRSTNLIIRNTQNLSWCTIVVKYKFNKTTENFVLSSIFLVETDNKKV